MCFEHTFERFLIKTLTLRTHAQLDDLQPSYEYTSMYYIEPSVILRMLKKNKHERKITFRVGLECHLKSGLATFA